MSSINIGEENHEQTLVINNNEDEFVDLNLKADLTAKNDPRVDFSVRQVNDEQELQVLKSEEMLELNGISSSRPQFPCDQQINSRTGSDETNVICNKEDEFVDVNQKADLSAKNYPRGESSVGQINDEQEMEVFDSDEMLEPNGISSSRPKFPCDQQIISRTCADDETNVIRKSILKSSSNFGESLEEGTVPELPIRNTLYDLHISSNLKLTKSTKKKSRKNSLTELAGSNPLAESLYEALLDEKNGNEGSHDLSDGYIDTIIMQSSKKSIDNGLDSSGDFLDESEDVFEQEERRKEICDNIVTKFLELTTEKPHSPSKVGLTPAPVFNVQSATPNNPCESPARQGRSQVTTPVPFFNLRANFLKSSNTSQGSVATPRSATNGRLSSRRSLVDIVASDKENSENIVKGLENKLSMYENKIDSLEENLRITKALAEDKDKVSENLARELKVTEADRFKLEIKCNNLYEEIDVKGNKISDLDEELRTLKSKYMQLENQFVEEVRKVSSTESKNKELENRVNLYEIEVNSLQNKFNNGEDEVEKMKDDLKSKMETIDIKCSQNEENKRRIEVLESDIVKYEEVYKVANMKLIKSVKENNDKESLIGTLKTNVRDLEREIDTMNQQSSRLGVRMKELESEEFEKKRAMFNKSDDNVTFSCKKCENFEKKVRLLESKHEATTNELLALTDKHDLLVDVNNQHKVEIDESLNKYEKLIAEDKRKESDILNKESVISVLTSKLSDLEGLTLKNETDLKALASNLAISTENFEESERNLKASKAIIVKLEESMNKLIEENQNLKNDNLCLESSVSGHDRLYQFTDSALLKCEAVLELTKKDFDVCQQELKLAKDDLISLKASKLLNDAKYDKLVLDYEEVVVKIREVEMRSEEFERNVIRLEKENEKLLEELTDEKNKNVGVVEGFEEEIGELMRL